MIDLLFAGFLALIGLGTGKRILDRFGQTPEHRLDAIALALPLGMGLMALGTLAVGAMGWLNRLGLSVLLALWTELGLCPAIRLLRELCRRSRDLDGDQDRSTSGKAMAFCLGLALLGTGMVAIGPVTDGDALCYHLQVPKEFLMQRGGGVRPRPSRDGLSPGDRVDLSAGTGVPRAGSVPMDPVDSRPGAVRQRDGAGTPEPRAPSVVGRHDHDAGPGDLQRDVRPAQRRVARRIRDGRDLRLDADARTTELRRGGDRGCPCRAGDRREVPGPGPLRPPDGRDGASESRRSFKGRRSRDRSWLAMAAVYAAAAVLVGGWWYLRAYLHTGNPVYPFFRHAFGGAGLDEVLDPIKRPMAVTAWNLLVSLVPLTLQPDRFDSFSHQFGPIFLLFLPAALLERPPRRVLGLAALGLSLSDALSDPATEHAVRADCAGTDGDRGRARGLHLVRSEDGPGAADGGGPAGGPGRSRRSGRSPGAGT